jgi:hypothetical protein
MMKKIILLMLLFFSVNAFSAGLNREGLREISDFANDVCDQISAGGEITRSKIEVTLNGNMTGLAKALGLSAGANGIYTKDNEIFKGVPYEKLPDQMSDSRLCKRELAKILINERSSLKKNLE